MSTRQICFVVLGLWSFFGLVGFLFWMLNSREWIHQFHDRVMARKQRGEPPLRIEDDYNYWLLSAMLVAAGPIVILFFGIWCGFCIWRRDK